MPTIRYYLLATPMPECKNTLEPMYLTRGPVDTVDTKWDYRPSGTISYTREDIDKWATIMDNVNPAYTYSERRLLCL